MRNLRGIDLNLLVSLDALLHERNVTRAAARLHLSQPALSAQLARLRRLFDDPLLLPAESGRGMMPTARALTLEEPLRAALQEVQALVQERPDFDPLQAERTFQIAASDNAIGTVGMPLMAHLAAHAGSGIRLGFRMPNAPDVAERMESGAIDLMIGSERAVAPNMKVRKLLQERFVMAQRKGHPRGVGRLDLDTYCSLRHVLVSPSGGNFHGYMDEQLERIGRRRTVALSVQQFTLVPEILAATDYVCTLPSRLAMRHADRLDRFDLPFKAEGMTLYLAWHPRNHRDPANIWLREAVAAVAAPKQPPASGARSGS